MPYTKSGLHVVSLPGGPDGVLPSDGGADPRGAPWALLTGSGRHMSLTGAWGA